MNKSHSKCLITQVIARSKPQMSISHNKIQMQQYLD